MVGSPVGRGSAKKQPTIRPTEYRCFIKEVNPLWRSGCENPIVEKFLRPPGNSPSRWHLTRGFLLCSTILYIKWLEM